MTKHKPCRGSALAGLLIGALVMAGPAGAYTFVAEPIYPPDKAAEVYKPLIAYLTKATGEKFTLVAPRNYHFYWRDIKKVDGVDFALDEAHLADYRMARLNFQAVVRTAEPTSYTIVTSGDVGKKGLEGLVGKKIVSMPAPSLGYALLLTLYPNPIAQPDIESSANSWRDATEIVFAGEADAAVIPTYLQSQFPNLTPVKTTRQFPGTAVTAAPNVPDAVKQKVREALLKLDQDPSVASVLLELGITKFVDVKPGEYSGSESVLKDFYGYQ